MKKLIKFILYILFLPFSVLISILKNKKTKGVTKLILSLLWIGLWVGFIAYCVITAPTYTEEERAATKTAAVLLTPTKTDTPEPTATQIPTNTPVPTSTYTPAPTKEVITINGENPGKYGKTVTTNAGTEAELTYIGYFLPAGKYTATNHRQYRGQLNVYSSETKYDDGIEYPAETNAYLIEPGESKDIEVPEGFYIKVVPPEDFRLTAAD